MSGAKPPARARGDWAEQMAVEYLKAAGLRLLARNYLCRSGEIDLVMQHGEGTVFVEVRYRAGSDFGSAAESIDLRKQQKVVRAAQHYLLRHPVAAAGDCRFDVVVIAGAPAQHRIEWITDAFQA